MRHGGRAKGTPNKPRDASQAEGYYHEAPRLRALIEECNLELSRCSFKDKSYWEEVKERAESNLRHVEKL